jgi:hypothetical protein
LLTSGLPVEAKTLDWDTPSEMKVVGDWDKPAELTAEQARVAAVWADAEKVRQAEVAKEMAKPKPRFEGITALFLRDGEGSAEKTINFSAKIQSSKEYKSTKYYPGVTVKALSSQPFENSQRGDRLKVNVGNILEVLRWHSGNDYHVYSFSKRQRGIVKIAMVEIME